MAKPVFQSARFYFDQGDVLFKHQQGTKYQVEVFVREPARVIAYKVDGRQIMNKTYAAYLLEDAQDDIRKGK